MRINKQEIEIFVN